MLGVSCEDLGVDESLSFLDAFVQDAIRKGAPQYSPPDDKDDDCACSTLFPRRLSLRQQRG